ncbi:MAG: YXWGXW repeat-containing protein [bacterium]|nr:YXWGXW repeat-containing protein [bacterium]MDI1337030.1 YXWGXW repeat-containing protein [Lacunisphaera sp.]
MNITKNVSLFALCGALGLLAGCTSEPESHLVTAPPPPAPGTAPAPQQVVVVTQPQQVVATAYVPGAANSYVVLQAPPAPQAPEAIPARPSDAHVWVSGYWTWQDNRYAWMAGHWVVPPYAGAKWVNPRSESEGGAFRFYEGHWA